MFDFILGTGERLPPPCLFGCIHEMQGVCLLLQSHRRILLKTFLLQIFLFNILIKNLYDITDIWFLLNTAQNIVILSSARFLRHYLFTYFIYLFLESGPVIPILQPPSVAISVFSLFKPVYNTSPVSLTVKQQAETDIFVFPEAHTDKSLYSNTNTHNVHGLLVPRLCDSCQSAVMQ